MLLLALKNRIWGIALTCICFFFSLPIYSAIFASMINERTYLVADTDALCRLFRASVLGDRNIYTSFLVFLLAVFFALNGFMYLFSRQKTDLYHALPVKRNILFTANYVAGIIAFIIPYITFTIITIAVGSIYGYINGDSIKVAFIMAFINILSFILEYSLSIAMIMLTGNLPVALLAIGTVNSYFPLISLIDTIYKQNFFCTYSAMGSDDRFIYTSPATLISTLSSNLNSYSRNYHLDIAMTVVVIIAIVLITAIAYLLYTIRPTESTSKAIAHRKMIPFLSVLLITPLALTGAVIFSEITNTVSKNSYGWFIFGMLITAILSHFILQTIYYLDYKSLFKNLQLPAIALVIAAIISIIYIRDLTGYDNYLPEKNIDHIALASYSLQGTQEYMDFNAEQDEWGYNNFEIDNNRYRFDNMKLTDSTLYLPLIKAAIADSKEYHELLLNDDTDLSSYNYTSLDVCFVNKNGRKIYRSYFVDLNQIMDIYNAIYCTKEYKEGVFSILTASDEELINSLTFLDGVNTVNLDDLSAADKKELLDTYKHELMSQDAYDTKNSVPIGYLCNVKHIMNTDFLTSYTSNKGYIYPSFTNTIALLKKHNVPLNSYKDVDTIQMITVNNYNLAEDDIATLDNTFTDAAQIKEILDGAYPYELICADEYFHQCAPLDVEVYYNNGITKNSSYITFSFEENSIPEFVKSAVKYTTE